MNALDYSGADYRRFICGTCRDNRSVAAPGGLQGSVPCPHCGTDELRRAAFTRHALIPEIRQSSLDEIEAELFREWRMRGFHELDCLRWIEGRRYHPEKDTAFLKDEFVREGEWKTAWNASAPKRATKEERT
jgi:hypothetical protein